MCEISICTTSKMSCHIHHKKNVFHRYSICYELQNYPTECFLHYEFFSIYHVKFPIVLHIHWFATNFTRKLSFWYELSCIFLNFLLSYNVDIFKPSFQFIFHISQLKYFPCRDPCVSHLFQFSIGRYSQSGKTKEIV